MRWWIFPKACPPGRRKCVSDFGELMNELVLTREDMGVSEFVEHVLERTGLKDMYERDLSDEGKARMENVQEFLGAVAEYEKAADNPSLEDYLENVALVTDLDNADLKILQRDADDHPQRQGSGISHRVHGGAWRKASSPTAAACTTIHRLEEERRLCYVAITRAREMLFISLRGQQRMLYNQVNYNAPSRFLKEIPERLLDDQWISQREKSFPGVMDAYSHPAPKRDDRRACHGQSGLAHGPQRAGRSRCAEGLHPFGGGQRAQGRGARDL